MLWRELVDLIRSPEVFTRDLINAIKCQDHCKHGFIHFIRDDILINPVNLSKRYLTTDGMKYDTIN